MANADITAARLREMLNYDLETGIFTWLKRATPRIKIGDVAGTRSKTEGYIHIQVDGSVYCAHRLAILYVTGEWPPHEVDHWNSVRDDNRWSNLRPATKRQNMQNKRRAGSNNGTGLIGAYAAKATGHFVAKIQIDGIGHYLGTYDTALEAHDAYCKFKASAVPGWSPAPIG